MARAQRAKAKRVWFWRWRHNSLRRHSDVVEARIVLATWMLALSAGAVAGQAVAAQTDHYLTERRAEVHAVAAVLTEDASDIAPTTTGFDDGRVPVKVRWTTADGVTHTARMKVDPQTAAGTHVTAWIDRSGQVVSKPPTATEKTLGVVGNGVLVGSGVCSTVLAGGWLVRRRLLRRRLAEWDAEWKRVDPQWRDRSGGRG
ncbi:hypothetical protein ACIQPR_33920 [Streptomyces sp. NPDC091280]|uniref:Rv1733c family protein n=1 Tax=Streptomyces sp. NPDC091280 TaxID=3365984 RepID=UPI00382A25E5